MLPELIDKPDLLKAVAEQIKKDFEMAGLRLKTDLSLENCYEDLTNEMTTKLAWSFQGNKTIFNRVFYRVDINEKVLKDFIKPNPDFEQITQLIIKRELMKVVYRVGLGN